MRLSRFHLVTTREAPADADIASHQLMLRAGMIRKLASGIYTWSPLGLRVLRKVEAVVREEMDRAGAIEVAVTTNGSYALSFPIPTLPNDQVIEFKLIKRIKATSVLASSGTIGGGVQKLGALKSTTLMASNFTYDTQNKYLGSYNFMDVKSSALSGVQISMKKVGASGVDAGLTE